MGRRTSGGEPPRKRARLLSDTPSDRLLGYEAVNDHTGFGFTQDNVATAPLASLSTNDAREVDCRGVLPPSLEEFMVFPRIFSDTKVESVELAGVDRSELGWDAATLELSLEVKNYKVVVLHRDTWNQRGARSRGVNDELFTKNVGDADQTCGFADAQMVVVTNHGLSQGYASEPKEHVLVPSELLAAPSVEILRLEEGAWCDHLLYLNGPRKLVFKNPTTDISRCIVDMVQRGCPRLLGEVNSVQFIFQDRCGSLADSAGFLRIHDTPWLGESHLVGEKLKNIRTVELILLPMPPVLAPLFLPARYALVEQVPDCSVTCKFCPIIRQRQAIVDQVKTTIANVGKLALLKEGHIQVVMVGWSWLFERGWAKGAKNTSCDHVPNDPHYTILRNFLLKGASTFKRSLLKVVSSTNQDLRNKGTSAKLTLTFRSWKQEMECTDWWKPFETAELEFLYQLKRMTQMFRGEDDCEYFPVCPNCI